MYFDPFNKALKDISTNDLEHLRDVAEGWYVEYKREPIPAKNAAKSLTAFANHFGGWLVFGVDAPQRVPATFGGLDPAQVIGVMDSLRDALRHHINPTVAFESRELTGPCAAIGLPAGRSIVLVEIPRGRNPPYIHSSGRIYRRLADASEPKVETDRAVIDELVSRASKYVEEFRKRLEVLPELAEQESEVPILQVLLTNDPWQERPIGRVLKQQEFSEIMRRTDDAAFSAGLESTFTNAFGFTARQVARNDPYNVTYTWEFSHYGFSSILVPLRRLDGVAVASYKYAKDFLARLSPRLHACVIDVNALWAFLTSIFAKHAELSKQIGLDGPMFIRFRFLNVWRNTGFVDSKAFLEHIEQYGIAVIQKSEVVAPLGAHPDSLYRVDPYGGTMESTLHKSMFEAAGVLSQLLAPLGVPCDAIISTTEPGGAMEILERAIRVQGMQPIRPGG